MLAIVLAAALAVSLKGGHEDAEDDRDYRDQNGDHVYYDESLIEKKTFHRLYPKEAVRTFRRLFGLKIKDE